jgi:hypothetical protein
VDCVSGELKVCVLYRNSHVAELGGGSLDVQRIVMVRLHGMPIHNVITR